MIAEVVHFGGKINSQLASMQYNHSIVAITRAVTQAAEGKSNTC